MSLYVDDILYIENPKDSSVHRNTRTDKWIQQGNRIQDAHTEISYISLTMKYQKETVKKKKTLKFY